MPADIKRGVPVASSAGSRQKVLHPQKRGDERRQAIITSLEELLTEDALDVISIKQITDRADVGRSAFYFYFSTKYAAVASLLNDRFVRLHDWAWPILTTTDNPASRWRAILRWLVDEWTAQPRMFVAMLDARNADGIAAELWEQWMRLYVGDLTRFIEFERTRQLAPAGPPAAHLAESLNAMNERSLENHLRRNGTVEEANELTDMLTHIWVSSIYALPRENL